MPPEPPRLLVVLATYNERENLPTLVDAIFSAVPEAVVLVIDDDSPDGTGRWAAEKSRSEPRLAVLHRPGKMGLGTATRDAMDYACCHRFSYMVQLDADWSHPPEMIPVLVATAEETGVDGVIGSRYIAGGKIVGWPLRRRVMSGMVNRAARLLLGLTTRDNSGSFRCYRVETLQKLDRKSIRSRGYSFYEEILFRLQRLGATFREVPICFTERRCGVSKINGKETFVAARIFLTLFGERLIKKPEPAKASPSEPPTAE